MAEWDGKSRGTVLGLKIFVFFIHNFGIRAAYALLVLPVPYFYFFSRKNVRGLLFYFKKRLNYSTWKSHYKVFKAYYVFGQTLIDKVAISSGLRNRYTYEFDGIENLKQLLAEKKGGILLSAHVGNFELAEFFFNELDDNPQISILVTDEEHEEIKDYMSQFVKKTGASFIIIKDDFSHIFEINAALAQNKVVCITGDRYINEAKCLEADFLGKRAKFPLGPFQLASRIQVPVVFVYVMREKNRHYHLYARNVTVAHRDAEDLLEKYVSHLQKVLKKYPLQWFNFYDFWGDAQQK